MIQPLIGMRQYRAEATLHEHDYHQIVLPHVGDLELEIAGRGGHVQVGVGAFIASGQRHAFRSRGANGFIVIDLAGGSGGDDLATSFVSRAFFGIDSSIQGLLDYACARLKTAGGLEPMARHWTPLLLEALSHATHSGQPTTGMAIVCRALAFMRRHASSPIRIREIASAAGTSGTCLHALFRQHHGISPHAMLMQWRLDAARRLLVDTNLSIAEIAVRTGHADQSSLTRRFREALGVTPAAIRRSGRPGRRGAE